MALETGAGSSWRRMAPSGRQRSRSPEEPRGRRRLQPQDLPAAGLPSGQRVRDQRQLAPPEPSPRSHARRTDGDEPIVRDDFRVEDVDEGRAEDARPADVGEVRWVLREMSMIRVRILNYSPAY